MVCKAPIGAIVPKGPKVRKVVAAPAYGLRRAIRCPPTGCRRSTRPGRCNRVQATSAPLVGQRRAGLIHKRPCRQRRVDHDGRPRTGIPADAEAAHDRVQVGKRGSAGDHDQVGNAGGCQRGIDQRRRGVDHDQVGPTVARGIEYGLKPPRLSRDHHRAVSFAQGTPGGRAPLRIQVATTTARPPARSCCTARAVASVDLPLPPFRATKPIVRMRLRALSVLSTRRGCGVNTLSTYRRYRAVSVAL